MSASRMRRALGAIAAIVALGTCHARGDGSAPAALARWTSQLRVPGTTEYRYTLTARVRPLLVFWITRSNVGGARVALGETDGARSFDMLIGSDPDRAPMRLNRWGYISETTRGTTTQMVGVMTESNEETVDQAKAALKQPGADTTGRPASAGHAFKAIRATITHTDATAQVLRVALDRDFTLHEVAAVLDRLPEGGDATAHVSVPPDASPGFLNALADRLHASAVAARSQCSRGVPPRTFVYDRGLYDLSIVASKRAPSERRTCPSCIESELEIRNRATGSATRFRLQYPTDGPLAEVPVRAVYRPRWWFEAELTLEGWR